MIKQALERRRLVTQAFTVAALCSSEGQGHA